MRSRTFALLGLVVFLGSAAGQVPEFKVYASSEGRYKILFPGAVKTDTVDAPAGKGMLKVTIDSVELRGGTVFMVIFADAPDEVAKQPTGPRIDKVRDANKGDDGKVLEEKELTVGTEKYPARDVLIQKGDVCVRNRIVIAGNRLYQVVVQGSKDVVTSQSATDYLASFEVTK